MDVTLLQNFEKYFFWDRITKFHLTFQIMCTMTNKIITTCHIFMKYILHIWKWYRVLFNRIIPHFEIKLHVKNRILQINRLLIFWRVAMYFINVHFHVSRFLLLFCNLKIFLIKLLFYKNVFKWICILKRNWYFTENNRKSSFLI